jgi:Lrp/AsnC family transcriptional regulator for asnA, asnC and gidA
MVDEKDLIILEHLEENARISFVKLGRILGMSETAVRKRVKKLEDESVILGYKANVNYRKLGFSNKIIMGVDTVLEKYFKVMNVLREKKFVKKLSTSSGDHMIMFEVWVKDMIELNEILTDINSIEGVIKSCPAIILEEND